MCCFDCLNLCRVWLGGIELLCEWGNGGRDGGIGVVVLYRYDFLGLVNSHRFPGYSSITEEYTPGRGVNH